MCNTYATPVTRATVHEFRPGFSAFGVPPPSMYIPVCQNTAFRYILFCGIPIALPRNSSRFVHPLIVRASRLYIHSISNLLAYLLPWLEPGPILRILAPLWLILVPFLPER